MENNTDTPKTAEPPSSESPSTLCSARWIILFSGNDEWESATGTLEKVIEETTTDRRHLNYGRTGFRIIPDTSEPLECEAMVMLDVFRACIETGTIPKPDSPCARKVRELLSLPNA